MCATFCQMKVNNECFCWFNITDSVIRMWRRLSYVHNYKSYYMSLSFCCLFYYNFNCFYRQLKKQTQPQRAPTPVYPSKTASTSWMAVTVGRRKVRETNVTTTACKQWWECTYAWILLFNFLNLECMCDCLWPYSCTCNSHCRICITGGEVIFNCTFYVNACMHACVRACHILPPVVHLVVVLVVVLVVLLSFCLGLYWLLSVHT